MLRTNCGMPARAPSSAYSLKPAATGCVPERLSGYDAPMAMLARVLDALENTFGAVKAPARVRAFDMLLRMTCGYPASEDACAKGWAALSRDVGISAEAILAAPKAKLVRAMRAGGIVPELRAERLVEIASRVKDGADLRSRKVLKTFPTIGDPGADRILLFTRVEPVAAVPSNATQAPLRLGFGEEQRSYAGSYRSAQRALDAELPPTFDARIRAYLLLRRHGEDVCKRSRPRCEACSVTGECAYFAAANRARR
jgi:endonuclease-3